MQQDLGWSAADSEALCPSAVQPSADAAPTAKGKTAAAAKKPATTDKKAAPAAAAAAVISMTEELVTGLETPCHVAVIRCHQSSVSEVLSALKASVKELKGSMSSWQNSEQANKIRWTKSVTSLSDLI